MNLTLPPITDTPDPEVEIRPVYVEEWIEALPYANPQAVLDTVLETLGRFNRSPVRPALRFTLLEHYLIPYQYLLEVEEGHLTLNTRASIERRRALADAARQVAMEMASGYKIVLSQAEEKRGLFGGGREFRTSVQRASLFLSFALLHCYDEYLPVPSGLWRELALLYDHADKVGIADGPVAGKVERPEFKQDVSTTFKRAVLTSLVDPYQLAFGDVWSVYQKLASAAGAAVVGRQLEVSRPAGFFVVDPTTDRRPEPYASVARDAGDGSFLIDANPALELLRDQLRALRKRSGDRAGRDAALIAKMVRSLGLPPRRHAPRETSEGRVHIAVGVSSVHHLLGGTPSRAPDPIAGSSEIHVGDVPEPGIQRAAPSAPDIWQVDNEGPGGVGLIRRGRPRLAVGVGELLGLQFPLRGQTGVDWSLGVIRWINIDAEDRYQAGVQLLGRGAQPVSLVYPGPSGADEAAPAIALPGLTADRNATLLASVGVFAPSRVYTVTALGGTVSLRAESLLESAGGYERFRFVLL